MKLGFPATALALHVISLALFAGCAGRAPLPLPPSSVARGDYIAVERYATTLSEEAIAKKWIQGLSIALVDDQRLVWSAGFGYADREAKQPATADTLYRVGSLAKLFTVTAALQLAQNGKLKLDAPVRDVLPAFSPKSLDGAPVEMTARMLMSHHSGLPRDVHKAAQSSRPPRFVDEAASFSGYLAYRPGEMFSYSNLGLSVLGSMVERASGVRFEQYIQTAVLDPLGMNSSAFLAEASPSTTMAKGYRGSAVLPSVPMRDIPAGGLNSSANDLSRFLMMTFAQGQVNGHRVLDEGSVSEMFKPQNTSVALDMDNRMGLGWFLTSSETARVAGGGWNAMHDGAIDGYRSTMMALPEHKLGVVVLTNSSSGGGIARTIAAQVLKVALEAKVGLRQPSKESAASGANDNGLAFVEKPVSREAMASWVGNYTTRFGLVRIYTTDNRALLLDAQGLTADLVERADGRFGVKAKLLGLVPVPLGPMGEMGFTRRVVGGRELLVGREHGRDTLIGEKLAAEPLAPAQRQFVETFSGDYSVINAGDDKVEFSGVRLFEDRGVLMVEVRVADRPQPRRMPLRIQSGSRALVLEALADRGDLIQGSIRDGQAEIEALGLRFRRIASKP